MHMLAIPLASPTGKFVPRVCDFLAYPAAQVTKLVHRGKIERRRHRRIHAMSVLIPLECSLFMVSGNHLNVEADTTEQELATAGVFIRVAASMRCLSGAHFNGFLPGT
jgi:hypothetical protein